MNGYTISLGFLGLVISISVGIIIIWTKLNGSLNERIQNHPIIVKMKTCLNGTESDIKEIKEKLEKVDSKIDKLLMSK